MLPDIIRAWKDPIYRASLSADEQARVPANPAGDADLSDERLMQATGLEIIQTTFRTCTEFTFRRYHCC